MSSDKAIAAFLACVLLLVPFSMSGCAWYYAPDVGSEIPDTKLVHLRAGFSTKEQVRTVFGRPSDTAGTAGGDSWIYYHADGPVWVGFWLIWPIWGIEMGGGDVESLLVTFSGRTLSRYSYR